MYKFSIFIEENIDKINLKYIKEHHIDEKIRDDMITHINNLPTINDNLPLGYDNIKNLIYLVNNTILSYKKFIPMLLTNTKYVTMKKNQNILYNIINSIIDYIKKNNIQYTYIIFQNCYDTTGKSATLTKSNFWIFMQIYSILKHNNIVFTVITADKIDLESSNSVYIYPDDAIYSGQQFISGLKNIICPFVEKKTNSVIIPCVTHVGLGIIERIYEYCEKSITWKELCLSNLKFNTETIPVSKLKSNDLYVNHNKNISYLIDKLSIIYNTSSIYKYVNPTPLQRRKYIKLGIPIESIEDMKNKFNINTITSVASEINDNTGVNELLHLIEEHKYTDDDLYEFFITMNIVVDFYNQLNPFVGLCKSIRERSEAYIIYKLINSKFTSLKENLYNIYKYFEMENNYIMEQHCLIYFQHKLADDTSVPTKFYNKCPVLTYNNNQYNIMYFGSLFKNCTQYADADCPPTYYRENKYTYQGSIIELKNLSLNDFDFS